MAENDKAIDQYWSFNPRLFSVLDRLKLHQKSTEGSPAHALSLEIWFRASENETDASQRLHLLFDNVSALKISPHGFIQIPVLEIVSIKEDQWEGLKYRVADTEENQISFHCKHFEVDIIDKEDISCNT